MGFYKSGSFTVPGSTGDYAVTGVGFQPQGVCFFGSNTGTLDSVVNNSYLGVFFGLMATDWDSASLLQHVGWVSPNPKGGVLTDDCIYARTAVSGSTGTNVDYRADAVSLDADGFTVNFTTVSAGTRYVHWLAWGGFDDAGMHELHSDGGDQTLSLGWRVRSLLTVGYFEGGDGEAFTDGTHWFWSGMGQYPSSGSGDFEAVNLTCVSSAQQAIQVLVSGSSACAISHPNHAGIAGTILGGDLRSKPTGGSLTDLLLDYVSVSDSYDAVAFWDGESSSGLCTPSDTLSGDVVVSLDNTLVDEVAAVLMMTTGDTNGFGTTLTGNIGFGVVTPDHQACVFLDGSEQRLYQSLTKGWCSNVNSSGAIAGTVALGTDEFTVTTTVDDGPSAQSLVYIAFGPFEAVTDDWIPHIYRIIYSK
jgi:hypothetical protein